MRSIAFSAIVGAESPIRQFAKQLFRYGIVGGLSALVEWLSFYFLSFLIPYLGASALAFVFSTFANWLLGRKMAFPTQACRFSSKGGEMAAVYLVSAVGLALNLGLMALFVGVWFLNPLFSKIMATGLVFIWNFAIRKGYLYR